MKNNSAKILSLLILLTIPNVNQAQSFGFGCLGLSGIYGGYSYHFYKPTGINQLIADGIENGFYEEIDNSQFKKGEGFIVGANLFRASFSSTFITLKGFYQFNKESIELSKVHTFEKNYYELNYNYWGLGIDLGFPLGDVFSLKLVDGGAVYSDVTLNYGTISEEVNINQNKFTENKNSLSYYLGSGLIVNVIKNYISLEISGRYHFTEIENLVDQNGNLLLNNNSKFIEKGGIQASVQLNLGIPY